MNGENGVGVSDGVVAQIEAAGKKTGWPGPTSGVGVDRTRTVGMVPHCSLWVARGIRMPVQKLSLYFRDIR